MKPIKEITVLLVLALSFGLTACGTGEANNTATTGETTTAAPTTETPTTAEATTAVTEAEATEAATETTEAATTAEPSFTVADNDEEIYMNNFGEYYDAYLAAMAADNIAESHALLAIAEAKALQAAGGTPMYGPLAAYQMTKTVYKSGGFAPWRGMMSDYTQFLITNEIITAADNAALKDLSTRYTGTGQYMAEARKYLEGKGYTFTDTFMSTFSDNPTTWNVFNMGTGTDDNLTRPTYDFLFSYDAEGVMQPHLATGYETSEGGKVYTVHIREGLEWVDSQGRKVADLTADDWVAAAQHQADVQNASFLNTYIEGMSAYLSGETTDFSTVGVKAIDAHTLQYTLVEPATYFVSLFERSAFAPLCRSYFLSQGGAFGQTEYAEASALPSYVYGTTQNNIVYCGQFICTNMTERNSVNYILNESYWNAENANLTSVKMLYNDGSDVSREYNDFKNGLSTGMTLRAATMEQAKANGDFEQYATATDPGRATFLYWFNLHRQTYANVADGGAPSLKTDAEKALSTAAFQNRHFRLALSHSIDRASFIAQNVGEDLKTISIRNSMTPGTYVALSEDVTVNMNGHDVTFPAGTWYGEIVQAQLDADGFPVQVWDAQKQTTDGWDAWYNPELAAREMTLAVEELAALGYNVSAENPVVVDFPYAAFVEQAQNQAYVLKTCIEGALGDLVRFDTLELNDSTELMNMRNNTNSGSEINSDMDSLSPIGSDHGDPRCFLDDLRPYGDGSYTQNMGLW